MKFFLLALLYNLAYAVQARETIAEAAANIRHLLSYRSDGIATMAANYPANHTALAGRPAASLEYFSPASNGSVYLLLMPIAQTVGNVLSSPTHEATLAFKDEQGERESKKGAWAVNRARVTIYGHVHVIGNEGQEAEVAKKSYLKYHPEARYYAPPHEIHRAIWARFDPDTIYYIGGFGDVHYIGWIPLDLYRHALPKERFDEDQVYTLQDQTQLVL